MTKANSEPIVIRKGPAPPRRPMPGKDCGRSAYYALVYKLKPGEWVEFSASRGLKPKELQQYVKSVRNWVRENGYAEYVEVYIADGDVVVVKAKEQPK